MFAGFLSIKIQQFFLEDCSGLDMRLSRIIPTIIYLTIFFNIEFRFYKTPIGFESLFSFGFGILSIYAYRIMKKIQKKLDYEENHTSNDEIEFIIPGFTVYKVKPKEEVD